jgi:threonyl-tRNA synthetase
LYGSAGVAGDGAFIDLLQQIYADFGFAEILVKLSTRPDKRIGSDEVWDKAEAALAEALARQGSESTTCSPAKAPSTGPKIEFSLKDCLGRVWQCGTLQLDFALAAASRRALRRRGQRRHIPVMLHRAILGSLERFIGILIENYAGAMPLWLSPMQAVVLNISEKQGEYAEQVVATLRAAGLRVEADLRNEKITYKIREHSLNKLPYQIVVGDKEVAANLVAVRTRGGRDLGQMSVRGSDQATS